MKIKSKLKYLISCLLSLYVASDSMAVNDLNKIRTSFNQEQQKIRIVFDATKKIDYRIIKEKNDNEVKVFFNNLFNFFAIDSTISFSFVPRFPTAPGSFPPCPASMAIT